MTALDETAFLTALAANPYDQLTRLVYADWLADHDRYADEGRQRALAEGYEALRVNRRDPRSYSPERFFFSRWNNESGNEPFKFGTAACLPFDWYSLIGGDDAYFPSLTDTLNAAALAFSKLPAHRRQELLAPKEVATNG